MNSFLFNIPASAIVGFLVGKLTLAGLHMPSSPVWIASIVVVCMVLLHRRSVFELCLLVLVSFMAEMSMRGIGSMLLPADALLSIIISLIMLPVSLNIMGMDNPLARPANV